MYKLPFHWRPKKSLMEYHNKDEEKNIFQVIAMIETADAIKNLDEILDVEGLDGAFIGKLYWSTYLPHEN